MKKNNMQIEIDANSLNISTLRVSVASFISIMPIQLDDLMDIKTALSEAITNAIDHGYDKVPGKVIVKVSIYDEEKIVIEVIDYGKGIEDIELAMTPTYTTKPEMEHAGMGFTIMESFMDQVIIDSNVNKGTKILLTKTIKTKKSSS